MVKIRMKININSDFHAKDYLCSTLDLQSVNFVSKVKCLVQHFCGVKLCLLIPPRFEISYCQAQFQLASSS